jgi:hypothetical protein
MPRAAYRQSDSKRQAPAAKPLPMCPCALTAPAEPPRWNIVVKPGAALSLQMHHNRAEHWIVVSGTAEVTSIEEIGSSVFFEGFPKTHQS